MDGIVHVIRAGEATLGRFDNIVSEALPTTIVAVESISASDRESSRGVTMIQEEKAVLAIRDELLAELDQVKTTAETISQIILSAN